MGVVFCNNEIEKVVYSGYTIDKILACGGDLVYSASTTPPTPTGDKLWMRIQGYPPEIPLPSGGTDCSIPCDGNSTLSKDDVSRMMWRCFGEPCVLYGNTFTPYVTDVVIGDCIDTIDTSAFSKMSLSGTDYVYFSSLSSVTIPSSVTTIGETAFFACTALSSITIPNSVTILKGGAFMGCALTSVTIPDSVTTLELSVFQDCSGLTSAYVGKGITKLTDFTFYKCPNLQTCVFEENVSEIRPSSLPSENSLQYLVFKSTTPPKALYRGCLPLNGDYVIYVPSESVDLYKNSSDIGWYNVRDRIQAIP